MSSQLGHTTSSSREDMLDMDYINSLPQPFLVRDFGDTWWWPVNDFEVSTGLFRIDVMGKLQAKHISGAAEFKDGDGVIHDSADFYLERDRCPQCRGSGSIEVLVDTDAGPNAYPMDVDCPKCGGAGALEGDRSDEEKV